MKRILLLAAIIALALSAGARADQLMYFKDSSRPPIKGLITKGADGYEVRHGGGSAAIIIPESEVDRVEELKTPQDEYRDRLAKINPTDPQALYKLADWAIENNLKIQAKELLEKACKIDPTFENARLKLRQLELSMRSAASAPGDSAAARASEPGAGGAGLPTGVRPDMLVSQEDIYRIRLGEIQPGENARVEFRNKVLDQFMKSMEGQGDFVDTRFVTKFRTKTPADQATYMLDKLDPGSPMLQDILIKSDPKAFIVFRTKVWPILQGQGGCASVKCHGGVNGAGSMRLFPGSTDAVAYTNFLTLRAHELINRGSPDSSPLLDYALPRSLAQQKHKSDINPIFPSREAAGYQIILAWINSLKRMDRYTVDYKVPGVVEGGAASAPAEGAPSEVAPPAASTSPAVMPWQAPAPSGITTPGGAGMPRGPGGAPGQAPPNPTVMNPPSPTVMPSRN